MVEASRPEAMVEFDYVAQESDELTICKGDIIKDIKTQPGGWWEGTLGDRRGMFPDNFVKIISDVSDTPKHKDIPPDATLRPVSGRRCKVLFSYQPANEDELLLQVNDVIDIIGEVEEGWWKGKLRDLVGVFPSNFVTEIDSSTDPSNKALPSVSSARHSRVASESEVDASMPPSDVEMMVQNLDAPVLPPKPVKELCKALFPYEAANDDELTLKEGDVIVLLSKEVADKGWWRGELRGRVGVFPDNFIEVIQQEEVCKKPERPTKSPLATTNRVRDTITKPTTPAIKNEPPETTSSRKSSEVSPRQEEKPSAFPPIPGKKPLLPLPAKKGQRNVAAIGNQLGGKHQDTFDPALPNDVGACQTSPNSYVVTRNGREVPEFDSVERSAMLNHPTASRVKAPRRRLPTNVHTRDAEISSGLMNGNAIPEAHEVENATRNRPQSRIWENKNKAPWMEELKMNQAKKNGSGPLKSPTSVCAPQRPSSMTDHPIPHEVTPLFGLTRQVSNTEMSTSAHPDHCPRPLAGISPKHLSNERDPGTHGSESRALHLNSVVDQPHSPELRRHVASKTPEKSPSLQAATPDVAVRTDPSSPLGVTNATQGPTIPSVQYLELMEKIVRLEKSLEQQRATFTQALKDVTDKLNEERTRRTHLEQEIDKLTNLVTQV